MLRSNLATRPFYNERAVQLVTVALVVLLAAITAVQAVRLTELTRREGAVADRVGRVEAHGRELQRESQTLRRSMDARELEAIAGASRDVNGIIERRVFSWTGLLSQFERTLPDQVRIASIAPSQDRDGRLVVAVKVVAGRAEDVDAFVERLQAAGTFSDVVSVSEDVNEEGQLEVVVEGRYREQAAGAQTASVGGARRGRG